MLNIPYSIYSRMIVWFHRFHNYVPFQRQRYQAISGGIDWYNAVVVLYPVGGLDAGHSEGLVARISSINGGFNGNIWPFWLKWFKTRDCLANLCVAMARNINVELLSGKVYTLAVRPDD